MRKWVCGAVLVLLCCLLLGGAAEDCWHEWVYEKYDNEYHHRVCALCGEAMEGSLQRHGVFCYSSTPDVCLACGATAADGADIQKVHEWSATGDADAVWDACRICGEIRPGSMHVHEWEMKIYTSAHCLECKGCEMNKGLEPHEAFCTEPDKCRICGAKASDGAIIPVYHKGEEVIGFDESFHWTECSECGEKFTLQGEYHSAFCSNPTVCSYCGASTEKDGVYIPVIKHEALTLEYDETSHWYSCSVCGADDYSLQAHYAACNAPDYCSICGRNTASDGIVIGSLTHGASYYEADENGHRAVCMRCGEIYNEGPHFVSCLNPGVCVACGFSCQSPVMHERNLNKCTAVDENSHEFKCYYCGKTVKEDHDFAENICRACGYERVTENWFYYQTVCSQGIRFRDIAPKLTNQWFMFTPLDLSKDGVSTIPLVAANSVYVGAVTVKVENGKLTVNYQVDYPAMRDDMAFALLPSLDQVTDVDIGMMKTYPFGREISIQDDLAGDTRVLLYVLGHADYDAMDERNQPFPNNQKEYRELTESLKKLMD